MSFYDQRVISEEGAIGGFLLGNAEEYIEQLQPRDFYTLTNQIIFSAIQKVGKSVDIIRVAESLAGDGLLDQVGMDKLSELASGRGRNTVAYVNAVIDYAKRQRLLDQLETAIESVKHSSCYNDSLSIVDEIQSNYEITTNKQQDFKSLLHDSIKRLDARFQAGGGINGLSTGFDALDRLTMGLEGGNYFILGARPSMGKTAFSLNLSASMAIQENVLYFSIESTAESFADRLIASSSNVDLSKIKTAKLNESEWSKLVAGVQTLKDRKLHIVDIPAIEIGHLANITKQYRRKHNIKVVVIDYIQLIRDSKAKTDFEEVSRVSRRLASLAKEEDVAIVALAQLSRDVEKRPDKRPIMSDLRATGQLEQDADIVGFLYRDEYYNEDTADKNITELLIRKNREGVTGNVYFNSNLKTMTYKEIDYIQKNQPSGYTPYAKQ